MKILVVEDELKTGDYLRQGLMEAGFIVDLLRNGEDGLHAALSEAYDLAILDVMLPGMDGWSVLKGIRNSGRELPALFLTARDEVDDRVRGLELGADDYVTKPFSPREVAARVRAILRREARSRGTEAMEPATTWQHDAAGMRIVFRAQTLDLTRYEYLLLALLLSSPGRVFTREQIMDRVWSEAPETSDRSIDTHVKTLRAKLRAQDPARDPIHTHRGLGYSIDVD